MYKHKLTLIQTQPQKVRTTKGTSGVFALVHEKMSLPAQVAEVQDYQMQYVQGYTLHSCTLAQATLVNCCILLMLVRLS